MTNLKKHYAKVSAVQDAQKRGRLFEKLLANLFAENGFLVHCNPKAARPRQTDLIVEDGNAIVLIEAKWRKSKIGVNDIDSLRARLGRAPSGLIGAMFSKSHYTESAIREAEAHRAREVLLFAPEEIDEIFSGKLNLHELICRKRREFLIQGKVWFDRPDVFTGDSVALRDSHDVFKMDSESLANVRCESHDPTVLFARNIHGIGYGASGGQDVIVTLRLMLRDYEDLERFLLKIDRMFGLTDEGSYCIHQTSTSWFGFGAATFAKQVRNWEGRYAHGVEKRIHDTEDVTYFDRFREGWISIRAGHHIRGGRGHWFSSAGCSIQLPGIPVDVGVYRQLCQETNNGDACFVCVQPHRYSVRLGTQHRLKVRAQIVRDDNIMRAPLVTGLVVDNPFFRASELLKELVSQDIYCSLGNIGDVQYLICYLSDWHDYGDVVDYYFLRSVDALWADGRLAIMPSCTWHKILKRVNPDNRQDAFLKAIEKQLEEDQADL